MELNHPDTNLLCLMSAISAPAGVVDLVNVFATFGAPNDEGVALLVTFYVVDA
jgi:hypothetical protein